MDWEKRFSIEGRLIRYRLMIALSHRLTLTLGKTFPTVIPLILVTGFPKSGTSWVSQLVADYLQLPLPRLSVFPIGCAAVLHGHEPPCPRLAGSVYVVRDGRDAIVSFYWAIIKRIKAAGTVPRSVRYLFPGGHPTDIKAGLPHFIDALMQRPYASPCNWPDHIRRYLDADLPTTPLIRYEQLITHGPQEFGKAMAILSGKPVEKDRALETLDKFSFERQTRVNPGDANRRKGIAGAWKDSFTREAAEVFSKYAGGMLIELGYEADDTWVDHVDQQSV